MLYGFVLAEYVAQRFYMYFFWQQRGSSRAAIATEQGRTQQDISLTQSWVFGLFKQSSLTQQDKPGSAIRDF
jgi:hypothetical protein